MFVVGLGDWGGCRKLSLRVIVCSFITVLNGYGHTYTHTHAVTVITIIIFDLPQPRGRARAGSLDRHGVVVYLSAHLYRTLFAGAVSSLHAAGGALRDDTPRSACDGQEKSDTRP